MTTFESMPNIAARDAVHVIAGVVCHPHHPKKIFLTRRPEGKHLAGLWEFPGGKKRSNESRFNALQRELYEEIGIQVVSAIPFHSVKHAYPEKKVWLDFWWVNKYSGDPHGKEGQQTQWVEQQQLREMELPEADVSLVDALLAPKVILISPEINLSTQSESAAHILNLARDKRFDAVLLKASQLNSKQYIEFARDLHQKLKELGVSLIISRSDNKTLVSKLYHGFDYYFLSTRQLLSYATKSLPASRQFVAECYDREELKLAQKLGCKFALFSPATSISKSVSSAAYSWRILSRLSADVNLPVVAMNESLKIHDLTAARYQGGIGIASTNGLWNASVMQVNMPSRKSRNL